MQLQAGVRLGPSPSVTYPMTPLQGALLLLLGCWRASALHLSARPLATNASGWAAGVQVDLASREPVSPLLFGIFFEEVSTGDGQACAAVGGGGGTGAGKVDSWPQPGPGFCRPSTRPPCGAVMHATCPPCVAVMHVTRAR